MMMAFLETVNLIMEQVHGQLVWFWPVLMGVLGGVFGSFLTCMLYRVPRGLNLSSPPSSCPSCGAVLRVVDLIPVVSWLLAWGKCRHCGAAVSARYVLIEAVCVALGVLSFMIFGASWQLWVGFSFCISSLFVLLMAFCERKFSVKVLLFSCIMGAVLWVSY